MNQEHSSSENTVTELAQSSWSDLYLKEDYWAIWLAIALVAAAMLVFFTNAPANMQETIAKSNAMMQQESAAAPFHTIVWHQASDAKLHLKGTDNAVAKQISLWLVSFGSWKNNPLDALIYTHDSNASKSLEAAQKYTAAKDRSSAALQQAQAAENGARAAGFANASLNQEAVQAIAEWRAALKSEAAAKKNADKKSYNVLWYLPGLFVILMVFFSIGIWGMGKSVPKFAVGFFFVYIIATLSIIAENQSVMKTYGFGYAAWAILFGMMISNTVGTPKWVMPAVQTEFYIKTGLVLLGAEILFGKILAIGIPGIFVAWVVTPIVLVCTYLFGQYILKIPSKTLNITVSADMSVCGVSAAIATAAACRAKKEELTLAVGISLLFTAIMMVIMPNIILLLGMPPILGGAWIGGTLDATGAVAAAGAFLGEKALYVAATVKMIQNILIGVIAFFVALYWCYVVDRKEGTHVSAWEIWHRFPKFVMGFVGASIFMSCLYQWMGNDAGYTIIENGMLRGCTSKFREWFFCLAFVSIGLATNFRELKHYFAGGKPVMLYVCGQAFNLILTLAMAYLMFYIVFPEITESI